MITAGVRQIPNPRRKADDRCEDKAKQSSDDKRFKKFAADSKEEYQ